VAEMARYGARVGSLSGRRRGVDTRAGHSAWAAANPSLALDAIHGDGEQHRVPRDRLQGRRPQHARRHLIDPGQSQRAVG